MPTEVRSPISSRRRGDQLGPDGPQPLSPGARSMPGGSASSDRGSHYPDAAEETEQPEQHMHVHLTGQGEEPERSDSLSYFRRLTDALFNRRPRLPPNVFRNFPRD
jgi:hypothetical protein